MPFYGSIDARVASTHATFNVNAQGQIKTTITLADGKLNVYVDTYNSGLGLVLSTLNKGDFVEVGGAVTVYTTMGQKNTAYPRVSLSLSSIAIEDKEFTSETDKYSNHVALLQQVFNEFPDPTMVKALCTEELIKSKIEEFGALCNPKIALKDIKLDQSAAKKRVEEEQAAKVGTQSTAFYDLLKKGGPVKKDDLNDQSFTKKRKL